MYAVSSLSQKMRWQQATFIALVFCGLATGLLLASFAFGGVKDGVLAGKYFGWLLMFYTILDMIRAHIIVNLLREEMESLHLHTVAWLSMVFSWILFVLFDFGGHLV